MTPHDLIAAFETLADAPDGVKRLRELVLSLAVRGRLVRRDADEGTAAGVLRRVACERHTVEGGLRPRRSKELPPVTLTEAPFEIPSHWTWCRLQDVGVIVGGGTPQSSDADNFTDNGGIPWLTPADMRQFTEGKYIRHGVRSLTEKGLAGSSAQVMPTGTVVFSSRAPIGYVAIAANPLSTNQGFKSVVPFLEGTSEFLRLYLMHAAPAMEAVAPGTTFKEVSGSFVASYPFPLPPLGEQLRIVARVDGLMRLLDDLEAARATRDEVRRAARDAALADLGDAPDYETATVAWARIARHMEDLFIEPEDVEPLRQAVVRLAVRGRLVAQDSAEGSGRELVSMIENEVASVRRRIASFPPRPLPNVPLPPGWTLVALEQIVAGVDAGWSPKCEGHPTRSASEWGVLKTTAVQANRFEPQHHKALPAANTPRPQHEVAEGDLLVTRAGPWFRVGVAAAVQRTRPRLMLSDKIIRCRFTKTRCETVWIALALNHGIGAEYLRAKQTGMDAAQMNISQDRLLSTPVAVPPLSEQRRIVAKVDALMALCDALEARLTAARDLHAQFAPAAVHHLDA